MSDLAQTRTASAPASTFSISREQLLTIVAALLAGAYGGYFLFTEMPALGTLDVFPRTVINHAIIGALAAVYLIYIAVARRLPGGTPLDLAVLGFIGAYALATITSIDWRLSTEATLNVGAAIIVFYALADLPFLTATALRRAFMLTAAALALYAIWEVGQDYADYLRLVREVEGLNSGNIFPATVPRVDGVSDHPNILAMVLVLAMPLFAQSALRSPLLIERVGGVLGFLAGGLAIFLTLSRGGWLGVGTGVVFTAITVWLTVRAHQREREGFAPGWSNAIPRDISPTALAAIAGALILVAAGTLAFLANSSTRPQWLFRGSLSPREDAWRSSLDMFGDYFVTGSGPHTFGLLYPQYAREFAVQTQHAHNGFMQVANDAGIVGVLALIALGCVITWMLARVWLNGMLEQRLAAVAVAGALLGFSAHNLVDAGNMWKATAIALAFVGAIVVRLYRETPAPDGERTRINIDERVLRYGRFAVGGVLLALLFVPFLGWFRIDQAHHDYWVGVSRVNNGEPGGIEALQDAVNRDPSLMVNQLELGKAQANAYIGGGMQDRGLLDAAIIHLERARDIDPRSDIARTNLARAYQLAGRDDDAAREAQLARLATHHVPPVIAVAEVYELMGDDERAVATYAQVIGMDASLGNSSFWEGTEWRRAHYEEILGASILGINPCTYGAFLVERGEQGTEPSEAELTEAADGCKLLVLGNHTDLVLRVNLARILMAQGAMDEAFEHLDYAVNRQPDFGPARTEIGRWYAAEGNIDEAKKQWVRGVDLDEAESVVLLGETFPPGDVPEDLVERLRLLAFTSNSSVRVDIVSILYYRLRYGRISPVSAIINGDWQQAVPRQFEELGATLAEWERESGA